MKLCDWCGEGLPDDDNYWLRMGAPHGGAYNKCQNRHVEIDLHNECLGALVGILREGEMSRPRPVEQKQGLFRSMRVAG